MRGMQKVMIIGTVGRTPEMRYLPSGKAVVSFSVAVGESWKDSNGQRQEHTEWFNCTAFDKLAEIIGEFVDKGSKVFLEGTLKTSKYQTKDGQERSKTELKASNMQMLDGKPAEGKQESKPAAKPSSNAGAGGGSDFEDDIPFAPRHYAEF